MCQPMDRIGVATRQEEEEEAISMMFVKIMLAVCMLVGMVV